MHGAHRFFLADQRNVYIVVISARLTMEENRLDHWLRMVRVLGGGSPTVVVVTHCDNEPTSDEKGSSGPAGERRLEPLDASALENAHSMPIEVVEGYSNFTGKNFVAVRQAVARAVTRLGVAFDACYPKAFFQLKRWLEGEPPDQLQDYPVFDRYLTVSNHFRRACEICGQESREGQDCWLGLLSDLGVIHWVGDRPDVARNAGHELQNLFFNPLWVKGPIYNVVCDTPSRENHGRVSHDRLGRLMADGGVDTEEDRRRITALMLTCELCFKIAGGNPQTPDYLIVDQVSLAGEGAKIQLSELDYKLERRLEWEFEFLPDHLLAQLLGRWFRYHEPKNTYFRDEVVFVRDGCRVQIRAIPSRHRLELAFHCNRAGDWKRLSDHLERELRSLFDPEDLWPETRFWKVIDPEKRPPERLKVGDKQLMGMLVEVIPQCAGVPMDNDQLCKLSESLEAELLRSYQLETDAQRLAWRACFVAFKAMEVAGDWSIGWAFPIDDNPKVIRQVGEWLSDHTDVRTALEKANGGRVLNTLQRGKAQREFQTLQKAYHKARRFLKLPVAGARDSEHVRRSVDPHFFGSPKD